MSSFGTFIGDRSDSESIPGDTSSWPRLQVPPRGSSRTVAVTVSPAQVHDGGTPLLSSQVPSHNFMQWASLPFVAAESSPSTSRRCSLGALPEEPYMRNSTASTKYMRLPSSVDANPSRSRPGSPGTNREEPCVRSSAASSFDSPPRCVMSSPIVPDSCQMLEQLSAHTSDEGEEESSSVDDDDTSEASDEDTYRESLPFFCKKLYFRADNNPALLIMEFPLAQESARSGFFCWPWNRCVASDPSIAEVVKRHDGTHVALDSIVENPRTQAEKVFHKGKLQYVEALLASGTEITQREYMRAVKRDIYDQLKKEGLQIEKAQYSSEEMYWKIYLLPETKAKLAEQYKYKVPISIRAGEELVTNGQLQRALWERVKDEKLLDEQEEVFGVDEAKGEPSVPVYRTYTADKAKAGVFSNFRHVDEIRLCFMHLAKTIDLDELIEQSVLGACFPGANIHFMNKLNQKWCTRVLPKFCQSEEEDMKVLELVRLYYGEMVAFFFAWLDTFIRKIRWLAALSLFSLVWYKCKSDLMKECQTLTGLELCSTSSSLAWGKCILQLLYTALLVGWASYFNTSFMRHRMRLRQKWGMRDEWQARIAVQRKGYKEELECREGINWRRKFTKLSILLYCILIVAVIFYIEYRTLRLEQELADDDDDALERRLNSTIVTILNAVIGKDIPLPSLTWIPQLDLLRLLLTLKCSVVIPIVIKLFGWLWGKLAIFLVERENHRTEERFHRNLAVTLSAGRIFVVLWPFIYTAFVQSWANQMCAPTLSEVLYNLYGNDTGPITNDEGEPLQMNCSIQEVLLATRPYVTNFSDSRWKGSLGQQIVHPHKQDSDEFCMWGCYPVDCNPEGFECSDSCVKSLEFNLLSFYVFDALINLLHVVYVTSKVLPEAFRRATKDNEFTLVEYQTKCYRHARYDHTSAGGCYTADFLQVVTGYALMLAFSQITPVMLLIGMICLSIEYKAFAFRMTYITCRPYPEVACGIGDWEDIIDFVGFIAITCNVLFALTHMPIESWWFKLLIFVAVEKGLTGMRYLVAAWTWPEDVRQLNDDIAAVKDAFKYGTQSQVEEMQPDISRFSTLSPKKSDNSDT